MPGSTPVIDVSCSDENMPGPGGGLALTTSVLATRPACLVARARPAAGCPSCRGRARARSNSGSRSTSGWPADMAEVERRVEFDLARRRGDLMAAEAMVARWLPSGSVSCSTSPADVSGAVADEQLLVLPAGASSTMKTGWRVASIGRDLAAQRVAGGMRRGQRGFQQDGAGVGRGPAFAGQCADHQRSRRCRCGAASPTSRPSRSSSAIDTAPSRRWRSASWAQRDGADGCPRQSGAQRDGRPRPSSIASTKLVLQDRRRR